MRQHKCEKEEIRQAKCQDIQFSSAFSIKVPELRVTWECWGEEDITFYGFFGDTIIILHAPPTMTVSHRNDCYFPNDAQIFRFLFFFFFPKPQIWSICPFSRDDPESFSTIFHQLMPQIRIHRRWGLNLGLIPPLCLWVITGCCWKPRWAFTKPN